MYAGLIASFQTNVLEVRREGIGIECQCHRELGFRSNAYTVGARISTAERNVGSKETLDGRREVSIPTTTPSHDICNLRAIAHVTDSFRMDRQPFIRCMPMIGRGEV